MRTAASPKTKLARALPYTESPFLATSFLPRGDLVRCSKQETPWHQGRFLFNKIHFPKGVVDESKYSPIAYNGSTTGENTAIKNRVGKRYEHKLDFLSLKSNLAFIQIIPSLNFWNCLLLQ